MAKSGFYNIGYITDARKNYAAEIRNLCGTYIDYTRLSSYVDAQWQDKKDVLFWDMDFNQLTETDAGIHYIMIDTSYKCRNGGEPIYGGFSSNKDSGDLDNSYDWSGIWIGTREMILKQWELDTGDLNNYTYIRDYQAIARTLNIYCHKSDSKTEWEAYLQKRFFECRKMDMVGVYETSFKRISYFPLGLQSAGGDELWALMDANDKVAKQKWVKLHTVTRSELLQRILSMICYNLGIMYFSNSNEANAFLQQLAETAMTENWTSANSEQPCDILRSYICHTIYRLQDEDAQADPGAPRKIDEVDGKIYFNSGLLNHLFRQIIIVGTKYEMEKEIPCFGTHKFVLMKNPYPYSESDQEIAQVYDGDTYKLPGIAKFFDDYRAIIFDARLPIRLNDRHIFLDGVERKRLPKYAEEFKACRDNESERNALLARISRDFDSALERAKLLAERNYRLAIPQFWREAGTIQFLLPIYLGELEEADQPHCALALSYDDTGRVKYYRGETILTLSMAYNNARLIAKPDVFWLDTVVPAEKETVKEETGADEETD